jgi:L,D-transpeptidase catalytic domain
VAFYSGASLYFLISGKGNFSFQPKLGREVAALAPALKPGDYVWRPEVAPAGPVVILVSLPDQLLYVYRNGVRIGRSTVSTGKPGKSTPTGMFTVLQRKVRHESSIRCADAAHAAAHLNGRRDARGKLAGLSSIGGLRPAAGGFCSQSLLRHDHRNDCHYRRNRSAPKETVKPGLLVAAAGYRI